jgi:large subunit ribosomal protein L19
MTKQIDEFTKQALKTDLPEINAGDTVKVSQKYIDKEKEKIQIFEGMVIARKHNKEMGATITVRKIASGIGVEKIFPIHSPMIAKIEVTKSRKVRRAKLYYLRTAKGKRAQLKLIVKKTSKEPKPKESK